VRNDDSFSKLLPVSLIAAMVFDLDVKVQGALTAVDFLAVLVWTDVLSVDFLGCASVVLLSVQLLGAGQTRVRLIRLLHLKG